MREVKLSITRKRTSQEISRTPGRYNNKIAKKVEANILKQKKIDKE